MKVFSTRAVLYQREQRWALDLYFKRPPTLTPFLPYFIRRHPMNHDEVPPSSLYSRAETAAEMWILKGIRGEMIFKGRLALLQVRL